jgi:hypothetical protein
MSDINATNEPDLKITYCDEHGDWTTRDITLTGMFGKRGRVYLAAHCHLRDGYRVFRLDCIRAMEVLPGFADRLAGVLIGTGPAHEVEGFSRRYRLLVHGEDAR